MVTEQAGERRVARRCPSAGEGARSGRTSEEHEDEEGGGSSRPAAHPEIRDGAESGAHVGFAAAVLEDCVCVWRAYDSAPSGSASEDRDVACDLAGAPMVGWAARAWTAGRRPALGQTAARAAGASDWGSLPSSLWYRRRTARNDSDTLLPSLLLLLGSCVLRDPDAGVRRGKARRRAAAGSPGVRER